MSTSSSNIVPMGSFVLCLLVHYAQSPPLICLRYVRGDVFVPYLGDFFQIEDCLDAVRFGVTVIFGVCSVGSVLLIDAAMRPFLLLALLWQLWWPSECRSVFQSILSCRLTLRGKNCVFFVLQVKMQDLLIIFADICLLGSIFALRFRVVPPN